MTASPNEAFNPPSPASLAGRGRVATLGELRVVDILTAGQFIIDHFEAAGEDGQTVTDPEPLMGGGGLYAATAARLFLPPRHVGCIVDVGDDFPDAFRTRLEALGDMVWYRNRRGKTSRALNRYSGARIGEGDQTFTYLAPTQPLSPFDLLLPRSPFADPPPEWIHVVCDITRATAVTTEAESFRSKGWTGHMAWEPLLRGIDVPTGIYVSLARGFAVFSPNHRELRQILGDDAETDADPRADVEMAARVFHGKLVMSPGHVPAIVVRAGELGAFTLSAQWTGWVPAFWEAGSGNERHVRDVTGGGNAFIGGLLAGLFLTQGDLRAATIFASTAASFAIEQRGIPVLTKSPRGHELWNGAYPWDRLRSLARRVDMLESVNGVHDDDY